MHICRGNPEEAPADAGVETRRASWRRQLIRESS